MTLRQYDYDRHASLYDLLELGGAGESKIMNQFLHRLFRRRGVGSVLDMTCGTGAQSIGLARYGYRVTGIDRSAGMLAQAREKVSGSAGNLPVRFEHGDIRTSRAGEFDAVISIFNAVGHLSPRDFERAMRNVAVNLRSGGTYVFDILNRRYMEGGGFKDYLYLDLAREVGDTMYVRANQNHLDRERGIMHIRQRTYIQQGSSRPAVINDRWDMQIYTATELEQMLHRNGFGKLRWYGGPNDRFDRAGSLSILVVARKR